MPAAVHPTHEFLMFSLPIRISEKTNEMTIYTTRRGPDLSHQDTFFCLRNAYHRYYENLAGVSYRLTCP